MSIQSGKLMNLGDGKILYDDLRSRIDGKDVTGPIAPSDTATATEAHAVGDVISVGGQLYVVTAAIAIGDTITEGTNVESTTVMAQMAAKMAALNSYAPKASPEFTGSISLGRKSGTTVGGGSMAVGTLVEATRDYSAALGIETKATGTAQFVFGKYNKEMNIPDWVSGTHYYIGDSVLNEVRIPVPPGRPAQYATARCECIVENSDAVFDETKWDIELNLILESDYVELVGNGEYGNPSNARTLDWKGNEEIAGIFKCQTSITIGSTTITEAQLQALLALLN